MIGPFLKKTSGPFDPHKLPFVKNIFALKGDIDTGSLEHSKALQQTSKNVVNFKMSKGYGQFLKILRKINF